MPVDQRGSALLCGLDEVEELGAVRVTPGVAHGCGWGDLVLDGPGRGAGAARCHLRGVLAPGRRADLNVIDFERLHILEPEVRADILACDEILSVGDFMFQQKCHDRMEQMLSGGTTLLFVSHDINQVKQLCKRAIWIDHGHLRGDGPSAEVCDAYVAAMQRGE